MDDTAKHAGRGAGPAKVSGRIPFAVIWGGWALFCAASIAWAIHGGAFRTHEASASLVRNSHDGSVYQISHTPTPEKRVLVVHSYHAGYEWTAGIMRGLRRSLSDRDVHMESIFMDTKRRPDEQWKQSWTKRALSNVEAWQPHVVILVDDNAQRYVGEALCRQSDIPIVFCGVNGDLEDYGYGDGVTGVLERPHVKASIDFVRLQYPDARRLAILTDASPTSRGVLKQLPAQLREETVVFTAQPQTVAEWQQAVRRAESQADVLYIYTYHVVKDARGQLVDPREIMKWTAMHCRIPTITSLSYAIDDGALCGVVESAVEQGELAGDIARQILNGMSPNEIPIVTATRGTYMLNQDTLRQLGVTPVEAFVGKAEILVGGQP